MNLDVDTVTQGADSQKPTHAQGPFVLNGPVVRPDPSRLPLRGDLAHIGLAGKYFVPHYAVPQPRTVMPGGAPLLGAPQEDAKELCTLMEGDSFELLDITGQWAWGCLSLEGPVGYVHVDRLEPVS
ncbi:SH3 domain-containing protein [Alteraurantiacibacter aquimixticola]|uniref:SH3 domain-containing protein n=1 Tax=Alteraurantiacibacter aquimixticola TaxID=2489173 RepID=UPI001FE41B3E|nr:SH3 domain-containing protein [Alteraurantiacibacter aquimixticola]